MLISQFALKVGLGIDTVRYYVRIGLLSPGESSKGGRNPYQIFSAEDVRSAQTIRLCQGLGMPLKDIRILLEDTRTGKLTDDKLIALMTEQRDLLANKAREMRAMSDYLSAKIAWKRKEPGAMAPDFADFIPSNEQPPRTNTV